MGWLSTRTRSGYIIYRYQGKVRCAPRTHRSANLKRGTCGTKVCCDGRNTSPRHHCTMLNPSGAGRHICRSCRVDRPRAPAGDAVTEAKGCDRVVRERVEGGDAYAYAYVPVVGGAFSSHNRDAASPRCPHHTTSHPFTPHFHLSFSADVSEW